MSESLMKSPLERVHKISMWIEPPPSLIMPPTHFPFLPPSLPLPLALSSSSQNSHRAHNAKTHRSRRHLFPIIGQGADLSDPLIITLLNLWENTVFYILWLCQEATPHSEILLLHSFKWIIQIQPRCLTLQSTSSHSVILVVFYESAAQTSSTAERRILSSKHSIIFFIIGFISPHMIRNLEISPWLKSAAWIQRLHSR